MRRSARAARPASRRAARAVYSMAPLQAMASTTGAILPRPPDSTVWRMTARCAGVP